MRLKNKGLRPPVASIGYQNQLTTHNPPMNELSHYDYDLPAGLIADVPLAGRDESRLLVVDRQSGELLHRTIRDLPSLLEAGDCLVLNDTRVIPARLFGRRASTGGRWEGLFLGTTAGGDWRLIGQTRGQLRPGEQIVIGAQAPDFELFGLELGQQTALSDFKGQEVLLLVYRRAT